MTLLELQRRMAAAVMQPLGTPVRAGEAGFIKRNDRLTAVERLEIYHRGYWYRVLDSFYEDFPGLRAVLGSRAFDRLAGAYLASCPSRSFTLRNLGSRLAAWLEGNPGYGGKNLDLALDMVRLEWAHIAAFDGPAGKELGPEDLIELGADLRLALQPYINLLALRYPADDLRVRVNEAAEEHGTASNAVLRQKERGLVRRFSRLKPQRVFVAVHRVDHTVYYRRLREEEYRLLQALSDGNPIGQAIETGLAKSAIPLEELQETVETWFATWSQLGWFCQPGEAPHDPTH